MGRKRIKEGLPNNLYEKKGYFNYKHPITKNWFYMGGDKEIAINEFIDYFMTDILPTKNLASKTIQDYLQKTVHIKEQLGHKSIEKIDTKDISEFLNKYPPTQSNYYRAVLSIIFKHVVAEGFTDKNPAASTIKKTMTKQRERLTDDRTLFKWARREMDRGYGN